MKLSTLTKKNIENDVEIKGIKTNSKDINNGDLFVCIKGANADRHDFIDEAIQNGASALIVSKDINSSVPTIKVDNPNEYLKELLNTFYNNPLDKLKVIGITGTDGKTTSAKIVQELIGKERCGYIGTLGVSYKDKEIKTNNTTPSLDVLYVFFDILVKENIEYLVMETSSEAFFYNRLDGIHFDIAGLTNITSDHMNTHKTLQNYVDCKKQLFINSDFQIINSNDIHFKEIKDICNNYYTYGYEDDDDLTVISFKPNPNNTEIKLKFKNMEYSFISSLLGKYNIENLVLALLICDKLGFDFDTLLSKTNNLKIKGRMQLIDCGQNYYCVIDYAHTINSINNVLEFARSLDIHKIITVTGQAGGRDHTKRNTIGRIVLEKSDYVIFTTDDPRHENPKEIIEEMIKGIDKDNYEIILDREQAIAKAVSLAKENDMILALGKGTDLYQKINDETVYYSEEESFIKAINK